MAKRLQRAKEKLERAINGYEIACAKDTQGGKGYKKPGRMRPW